MIVALSQLNSTVGDLNGNADLINEAIQKVRNEADIIVFPEMVLTGYPPKDLLLDSSFINNAYNINENLTLTKINLLPLTPHMKEKLSKFNIRL